ncbi:MAG: antibiotic biosynthesis monooxygenase [Candidatus Thiodiazotropha sp. (ex. Lucinisca nassula)]|nr:antibiotic biosynthesis monooxygenase [Candidatus Thiodiazotropha sp. (ex. Lucinisca nassula)]MBW9260139.1 antibiotic biosynthesis monooxygenase [Candidatus Thiodiazotropha sp. (ex. Lucinisca nassula)]MBW9270322.1 antibiotic biosynthesis monooxygenase [Candidatus Thiodiazotropha sp. (ex. Lucinisca nassula)]
MTESNTLPTGDKIDADPPVTVMVTRKPVEGKEQEFEDYITGITNAAMQWPGHMGTNVFRPNKPNGSYRIVFRFDHLSNLQNWENSPERAEWREIAEQVSQPREIQTITGLEAWFTLPDCAINVHPPKYKMAFLVWLGVFTLVTLLSLLIGAYIEAWPLVARTFILTVIVVPTLTYFVLPVLTRVFSRWLYPSDSS